MLEQLKIPKLKIYLKRMSKIGVFCIIFAFILNIIGKITTPKWRDYYDSYVGSNIRGFQDEKEDTIDVLFIGNSYLYKGISPMDLYEESGITSYNYSCPGQRIYTAYYYIKNALKTQKPKAIFLNVDAVLEGGVALEGNTCRSITCLPIGKEKFQALFDKNIYGGRMIQIQCFFPILGYHDRIRNLTKEDITYAFSSDHSISKGFAPVIDVAGYENDNYMDVELEGHDEVIKLMDGYFTKIINLCKLNDVEFVLFEVPCHNSWNNTRHIAMQKYADEKSLKFLDMNIGDTKVDVDWQTDTGDFAEHLNLYGARKVTDYMGKYLKENYDLKNHRHEKGYEQWEKDLINYHNMLDSIYTTYGN